MAKTHELAAQLLERLDPKLKQLFSKLSPQVISRCVELLNQAVGVNRRINPNLLVKYAVLLVAAERELMGAAVSSEHTARARAEQAGEYCGFKEGYEKHEEAWRLHKRGRKARQRIAASLAGVRRSWKKTQQVIRKNRPDLPLHVQKTVSDENLKLIGDTLQKIFGATELQNPLKESALEKKSTRSIRTYMLWVYLIPQYRGRWKDMHDLAYAWTLSRCDRTDSFRRMVLKNSSDAQQLTVPLPVSWIETFAEK